MSCNVLLDTLGIFKVPFEKSTKAPSFSSDLTESRNGVFPLMMAVLISPNLSPSTAGHALVRQVGAVGFCFQVASTFPLQLLLPSFQVVFTDERRGAAAVKDCEAWEAGDVALLELKEGVFKFTEISEICSGSNRRACR